MGYEKSRKIERSREMVHQEESNSYASLMLSKLLKCIHISIYAR